jgi:hypothetical protein
VSLLVWRLRVDIPLGLHGSINLKKEIPEMTMKLPKNLGMLLLGVWLILSGLIPLLNLSFSGLSTLLAILAIAAGALILLGR